MDSATTAAAMNNLFFRLLIHLQRATALVNTACAESANFAARAQTLEAAPESRSRNLMIPWVSNKEALPHWIHAEVTDGFPLFHGLAVMSIASFLEAFVEDAGVLWISSGLMKSTDLERLTRKTKGDKLMAYGAMSPSEKARHLWDQADRQARSEPPRATSKFQHFEKVFGLLGLPSKSEEDLQNSMVELYAVRNVIAHRNGVADGGFLASCNWAGLWEGAEILVTDDKMFGYARAAGHYASTVASRILVHANSGLIHDFVSELHADVWRLPLGVGREPPDYED